MRIAPVSSLEEHQETASSFAADWDTTPEQMMINKQEIAEVRNAVQMLPEKYRIPICLSYSAGLTMEEIATCMKSAGQYGENKNPKGKINFKTGIGGERN